MLTLQTKPLPKIDVEISAESEKYQVFRVLRCCFVFKICIFALPIKTEAACAPLWLENVIPEETYRAYRQLAKN